MTTIEDIRKKYLGDELYTECNQGGSINDHKLDMRANELGISKETLINQCKLKSSTLEELFDKFTYTVKKGTKITRVERVKKNNEIEHKYKWYTLYREETSKNYWVELKCNEDCVYKEYIIPYDMKLLRLPYPSAEMDVDTENESNYEDFWKELIILLTNIVDNTDTNEEYKFRLKQSIIEFITAYDHETYEELHPYGVDYTMAELFICQTGFKGWVRFVKRYKTHPSDEILLCDTKDLIEIKTIKGKKNDIISQLEK